MNAVLDAGYSLVTIDSLEVISAPAKVSANFGEINAKLDEYLKSEITIVTDESLDSERKSVAELRKFAKLIDARAKEVVSGVSGDIESFMAAMKILKQRVLNVADDKAKQISVINEKRLKEIEPLIFQFITDQWESLGIEEAYRKASAHIVCVDIVKLSAITPGGALTKATKTEINNRIQKDLALQNRTKSRILEMENQCLRNEINPPLTRASIEHFLFADDEIFDANLGVLINAELTRKAEAEERLRKKLEAEKQSEIEAALKAQQAESDRIAKEKAEAELASRPVTDSREIKSDVVTKQASKQLTDQERLADMRQRNAIYPEPEVQQSIKELEKKIAAESAPASKADDLTEFTVTVTFKETIKFTAKRGTDHARIEKYFSGKFTDEGKSVVSVSVEG